MFKTKHLRSTIAISPHERPDFPDGILSDYQDEDVVTESVMLRWFMRMSWFIVEYLVTGEELREYDGDLIYRVSYNRLENEGSGGISDRQYRSYMFAYLSACFRCSHPSRQNLSVILSLS